MSAKTSAVSLSDEIREFVKNQMLDVQKECTRFIEDYVRDQNRRISNLELEVGNENNSIVSSHSEQTNLLPRSEATAFDKKNKPDGLKQWLLRLQDELSDTNARIKDLEALFLQTNESLLERLQNTEDSLRNLVKKELDAVLEEKVESCVVKYFGKQEKVADDTRNRDLQRGISQSSIISPWRRDRSYDESEEWKDPELDCVKAKAGQVPSDSDKEVMKSRQDKAGTLRGVRSDKQPKSLDGMLEENLQEFTVRGVPSAISSSNGKQPPSLESRIEEGSGEDTGRGMQHTVSTRTLDQPMSLEGQLERDTDENTDRKLQHTVSTRTLDQPMSLEGQLEGGTSENTPGVMQHTVSTRTLVQPMSLEGQLEGGTSDSTPGVMQHTVSTRTLVQPMSLEGRLEGDPSENTPGEMQPASSTRNLEQPMSLEGRLEENKAEAASETKPPIHQKNSGAKSKMFGLFYKKPKKSS